MLGAGAPIGVVAARFGLSRFSVGRYRKRLQSTAKPYWRALRRAASEGGLKRATFLPVSPTTESLTP